MAYQVYGEGACPEWQSYVRGYHEYKGVWFPTLLCWQVEQKTTKDQFAVAVAKDRLVVGHVPNRAVSLFLKKSGSVGFVK